MTSLVVAHFVAATLAPLLVRWWGRNAFLVLALVPGATALWALVRAPAVVAGRPVAESYPWAPEFGLTLAFRMDVLGLVMTLIAAGIGALILVYCARYFTDDEPGLGRFAGVLTGFAGAMLGLVLADDMIQLFIYWELTTVFSYLLIGHYTERKKSRRAATTALTVTTLGGLAMLVGVIMLGETTGTYIISELLADPPGASALVGTALVLILIGALSKSALTPFSLWLPAAMQAPTPVSGYLHAAAMVKAGVYLIARFTPAFGDFAVWQAVTIVFGLVTMVLGGWKALRQYDLKLLLAYGTISQLGFLTALLGAGTRNAALAGLAMLCAHALFKAALFLLVGIIDHGTGTRDLRELSGLRRSMPAVFWVSAVVLASMAGLPPTAGFVAKEAAFGAFGNGGLWETAALAGMVVGSVLTVGYSLRFLWGAFATKPGTAATPVHAPDPLFLAPAAILAALSLIGGPLAALVDPVAAVYADSVPWTGGAGAEHLLLWHGFEVPLLLSVLCVLGGFALFGVRGRVEWLGARWALIDPDRLFRRFLAWFDTFAVQVTGATQRGSLPIYLGTTLVVLVVVCAAAIIRGELWEIPAPPIRVWDTPLQLLPATVIAVAALWTLLVRRRLFAVILVGLTGYGTASLFVLQGAPDIALTQFLVETISLVVFVLVLRRLPSRFSTPTLRGRRIWNLLVGAAMGAFVASIAYFALAGRQAESVSSGFPAAAEEAGGKNIISVILVDLRAWDTMGEISVLAVAAAGVASLMFVRRRTSTARTRLVDPALPQLGVHTPISPAPPSGGTAWQPVGLASAGNLLRVQHRWNPLWLPGAEALSEERRSIIFEVIARMLFPVIMLLSVYLLFTGHTSVGGGFAGGIVAGLGLMVRYLAGGRFELYASVRAQPGALIGFGLVIALGTAVGGAVFGTEILEGAVWEPHVPLLGHLHLTSSLIFDFGVYLLVIGLVLDILRSLGARIDEQLDREAEREAAAEEVSA